MNKKVGDLIVRSPDRWTAHFTERGNRRAKNQGQRLGQIDVLKSGYKIRVDVDEHYIARIYAGLKGWFAFNNDTFYLKIFKVFTQVTNGVFNVDMEFVGKGSHQIFVAAKHFRYSWRSVMKDRRSWCPEEVFISRQVATGSSK